LRAETLNGIEDGLGIGLIGSAELLGPIELRAHHVDDRGIVKQGLQDWRETGLLGGLIEGCVFQTLVLVEREPIAAVHDLLGIDGGLHHDGEDRVRIEGYGREKFVEASGGEVEFGERRLLLLRLASLFGSGSLLDSRSSVGVLRRSIGGRRL